MAQNFINTLFHVIQTILTFCLAIGITLTAAFFIIDNDVAIKKYIKHEVCVAAGATFICDFNTRIASIDFLNGALVLHDIVVLPRSGKEWFWTSDSIKIKFSWKKLFLEKKISLHILCGNMELYLQMDQGAPAIQEHIMTFLQERTSDLPIMPEYIHFKKVAVTFDVPEKATFKAFFAGAINYQDNKQQIGITFFQESFSYGKNELIKNIECSIKKITDLTTKDFTLEVQGVAHVRNGLDNSFSSGKIQASITPTEKNASFVSDDSTISVYISGTSVYHLIVKNPLGRCVITTGLTGQVEVTVMPLVYDPFTFLIDYKTDLEKISLKIYDEHKHQLETVISYSGDYAITGSTEFLYDIVHKIVPQFKESSFLNTTTPFTVHGFYTPTSWNTVIDCSGIQYRLPYTYNFLRSVHVGIQYDPYNAIMLLKEGVIKTDRGLIKSGLSTVIFDKNYQVQSVHVPLIVQNFFINKAKDFLASLSGVCTMSYCKDARSKVQGICALRKCHIRNNPFSGDVAGDIISATINPFIHNTIAQTTDLDLTLRSYEPVDIKTPFLNARAHIDLHLLGTISQPSLHGQIELVSGTFNFPYKPLEITSGKIFFIQNIFDDPEIEICATALIKDYRIMMYVDGTAAHPSITFSSTPSLQEEQIIGLLFGGSPDNSLSLAMPLSSVAHIEQLIVGSPHESLSAFDSLKSWLGPFENVRIIPRFSDQTGRGGVRGALAIEVNDSLSALIQQNFNLTEDTLIEVAYKPFDELTVRGIRDERGDFGGELEARFTW